MLEPVWGAPPVTYPTLRETRVADLCVVGLGGSGLAAVAAGLAHGMSVVGLEADRVASGAAGRNGGFLLAGMATFHHRARKQFGSSTAAAFYQRTADEIARMATATSSVRRVGSVRIAADDAEREDIALHLQALRADRFPAELYSGPEGDGLLVPGDGVFDPALWCRGLAENVARQGATLFEGSRATGIDSGRVFTAEGEVRCGHVVVAVDGCLELILPELEDRVTTWRLQMLATAPLHQIVTRHAVYYRNGLDYWQQLPDGRLALGGGRDKGGDDEQGVTEGTSAAVQSYLDTLVRDRLGIDAPIARRWSGRVAFTDDGLPVCEEVRSGVLALGGYCGTGNVVGAICAREAVSKLAGDPAPFIELLEAARTP